VTLSDLELPNGMVVIHTTRQLSEAIASNSLSDRNAAQGRNLSKYYSIIAMNCHLSADPTQNG